MARPAARDEGGEELPIPARIVPTENGSDVLCPTDDHKLAEIDASGRIVIKCRGKHARRRVSVEDPKAK